MREVNTASACVSRMIWALQNEERVTAEPGGQGECPCCRGDVLAKCGSIVTWHWAHKADDCDTWHEPESEWHIGWKRRFPEDWQEVVVGNHRADVKTPKLVVELQASSISAETIQEREQHYRNMVWLLRGEDFKDNLSIRNPVGKCSQCGTREEIYADLDGCWKCGGSIQPREGYITFRWRWPRKSWWSAQMPVVIDTGDGLLLVKKLHANTPCGGWGVWITETEFLTRCGATCTTYA